MPVEIKPLARSIHDGIEDESLRLLFDEMAKQAVESKSWKTRKKAMLDVIKSFQLFCHGALGDGDGAAGDGEEDDGPDPDEFFYNMLPLIVGVILEKLAEKSITCIEQAAFYLLSGHPEHSQAADAWIDDDYKRIKAFKKFLRANRYYKEIIEAALDHVEGVDGV
ncbi:MAG: hypothetical protein CMF63_06720 [Magnetovibrio sp.]|nr:hypothetical protein [Magnetovibrio sp.]